MTDPVLNLAKRIKSIADTGLLYNTNDYDRERYTELLEISHELTSHLIGQPIEVIKDFYAPNKDYPTPKVDVRGLLLNEKGEILLAREMADGKWTLPGGWADIGFSPAEVIEKEFREETGLQVKATRLLAVFDKRCHPHPAQAFYVYKFALLVELNGPLNFQKGFDILDTGFFPIDQLPELSKDRILQSQIELLYKKAADPGSAAYFD
ncbi:NUDIX hydrolase [Paraflavitalea sp. CAU 1676]|uniref:NUDIX hydrolase n=1 Tax=Paraflavitalea sp. CAU 1676 TaxID=3032598 RepID=UPI0023DBCCF3|nr:NUDIX hydrolase [Paraflavitalea sp. CAU 1676]MDF2190183.1 NUDIX hydrolase [Paraflavitalea sp. CAU 1676]